MVAGSGAFGHMASLELTLAERRGPEPLDTWQCWRPPQQRGGVWSRRARGSVGAHLSREAGSGAVGHVVACYALLVVLS
jgi:hypothetical protein